MGFVRTSASCASGRAWTAASATVALALALVLEACGARAAAPTPTLAPTTAVDPPPYTPPSSAVGTAGAPTGLAVASGFDQARRMALEVVEAIRSGDGDALTRLLDAHLARALPFVGPAERPREQFLVLIMNESRRRALDPVLSLEDLVAAERIEVAPLASLLAGAAPPEGLRATDLVVQLPLEEAGRRALRRVVPGWVDQGRVIVRVGAHARVVGL